MNDNSQPNLQIRAGRIYRMLKFKLYLLSVKLKFNRVREKFKNLSGALINVGAGGRGIPGWINVDLIPKEGVNCVCDCRKRLPFPDNSARGIFVEHFFEHIHYLDDVPFFLKDCLRVLAPGGVLRIIVPDAEKYLRTYCEPGWDAISKIRPLDKDHRDFYYPYHWNTKMELVNFVFRQEEEHKFAYDGETLEFVMRRAGFKEVIRQEFGKSHLPDVCLDWDTRASESLYVEGVKAA